VPTLASKCQYCGRETEDPERICGDCRRKRLLGPSPIQTLSGQVDDIKRLLEELTTKSPDEAGSMLIAALQQRVDTVELLFRLIKVQITATSVHLVDANKIDRLSADERVGGFLLAWATLFAGALLEKWLAPSVALVLAIVLLGGLAGYFYWRALKAQREIKQQREQISLEDLLNRILGGSGGSR